MQVPLQCSSKRFPCYVPFTYISTTYVHTYVVGTNVCNRYIRNYSNGFTRCTVLTVWYNFGSSRLKSQKQICLRSLTLRMITPTCNISKELSFKDLAIKLTSSQIRDNEHLLWFFEKSCHGNVSLLLLHFFQIWYYLEFFADFCMYVYGSTGVSVVLSPLCGERSPFSFLLFFPNFR